MDIKLLSKEKYEGYKLDFSYVSQYYYDLQVDSLVGEYRAKLIKKKFNKPFINPDRGVDWLYADYWQGAEAYGIEVDGELIGVIELFYEEWSTRCRVTELWLKKDYRRQGIGTKLMNFAKKRAGEMNCRLLILETQTSNADAVAFYIAQGFNVIGYDVTCYGDQDATRGEVRLELGYKLQQ
ncbi:MAG: GNAT family N-acetyltransferase [Clostridia bacterium]|nr:GNAT family N-acetyltransferase [Clostridia bacterium]